MFKMRIATTLCVHKFINGGCSPILRCLTFDKHKIIKLLCFGLKTQLLMIGGEGKFLKINVLKRILYWQKTKHKQQRSVDLLYLDTAVGSAANSDHDALCPLTMYCCQQLYTCTEGRCWRSCDPIDLYWMCAGYSCLPPPRSPFTDVSCNFLRPPGWRQRPFTCFPVWLIHPPSCQRRSPASHYW